MIIETPLPYKCKFITFDFAYEPWQRRQYWELRKKIFCDEQQIFRDSDRDGIDERAIPIVAECSCGGALDEVIGVVRIDEREPGVWFGSRLGVAELYRLIAGFNSDKLFDGNIPVNPFTLGIGAGLIFKAVSTARALGCREFYAHIQVQNVKLFQRLHWRVLDTVTMHGIEHAFMQADLDYYPPSAVSLTQLAKWQQISA
ncbi:hypothetical protein LZD49_21130 [Dyadobacter sp. CY261]|uniref:MSMEG_0567/Sll0786 family nitrogen starvation N-acetyltransferase n=1 Tax=Dyadobacter sp. CY261 TaxID=2907203 RepID=UPI001F16ECE5|nr:MSMEG_0567/Sll0786 family nitrogen starvation N-acetyltransferase [Dyadobacter sp. CY261]MCF0072997.1 hypothetical protein [Dyadobacter sp. CY261]